MQKRYAQAFLKSSKFFLLLLLLFFFLKVGSLQAQNIKIDSLFRVLKTVKEDTNKFNILDEIARQYYRIDEVDKQFAIAQKMLALAKKLKFTKGLAKSHFAMSYFYYRKGDAKKAFENLNKGVALAESIQDKKLMAGSYRGLSDFYRLNGDLSKSLEYSLRSLKAAEQSRDENVIATSLTGLANYYRSVSDYSKALEYALKASKIAEKLKNTDLMSGIDELLALTYANLGNYSLAKFYNLKQLDYTHSSNNIKLALLYNNLADLYVRQKAIHPDSITQAIYYIDKALILVNKASNERSYITYLITKGEVYFLQKNYAEALKILLEAFRLAEEAKYTYQYAYINNAIADVYSAQSVHAQASEYYQKALSVSVGDQEILLHTFRGLAYSYVQQEDFKNAYIYQKNYHHLKDSLFSAEIKLQAEYSQVSFELEKRTDKITLLEKDKILQAARSERTTLLLILALVIIAGVFVFTVYLARLNQIQRKTNHLLQEKNEEIQQQAEELNTTLKVVEQERQKSDKLLLNILPEETAQELKETGAATPKHYEMVSVLFTDFKGFTQAVENLKPIEVIQELDFCFNQFDEIIEKYGLERIKTIGDAYMAVGGLPVANGTNPTDAVQAGLEIQAFMNDLKKQRESQGKTAWQCRLGIHSGEVIAGVVGTRKFAYDIWGDTVNLASRMESSGEVGKVNISGTTYQLVKDKFQCEYRGKIEAKNKGEVAMYFVEKIL